MNWTGIFIFILTYVLISSRRLSLIKLDRPAAALLGAVLVVVLGVLSPEDALSAINGETLMLLFGVMGIGAFLSLDGFFDNLEEFIVSRFPTRKGLISAIIWGSGILSAFITNDAVCILGAPVIVRLIKKYDLPPLPFLLALASSANTGSVATLVGNPQNMLIGFLSNIGYRDYLIVAGPVAFISLAINNALIIFAFRRILDGPVCRDNTIYISQKQSNRKGYIITLFVIVVISISCVMGANLAWVTPTGLTFLMLIHRKETSRIWNSIDWSLILFFAGLFVVVEGFKQSGVSEWMFAKLPLYWDEGDLPGLLRLSSIFLIGSNVVSNVPFILLIKEQVASLPNQDVIWSLLAIVSTFAGNLVILGSAANVIVVEKGRDVFSVGFFDHLKIGFPLAVLTSIIGTVYVYLFF